MKRKNYSIKIPMGFVRESDEEGPPSHQPRRQIRDYIVDKIDGTDMAQHRCLALLHSVFPSVGTHEEMTVELVNIIREQAREIATLTAEILDNGFEFECPECKSNDVENLGAQHSVSIDGLVASTYCACRDCEYIGDISEFKPENEN